MIYSNKKISQYLKSEFDTKAQLDFTRILSDSIGFCVVLSN